MLVYKVPTNIYPLSGTGAIVTLEIRIPIEKGIWNHHQFWIQEKIQFWTNIIPELSPKISNPSTTFIKKTSVHEPFIDVTHFSNPAENKHTDTTDDSHTDNEDYVDKINVKRDEDKYDKYKGDISEYSKNDEIVINKT